MGQNTTVQIGGKTLAVSNLDKVLYPETGFTKGELIDYYVRIAPILLPHIRNRPMSMVRHPNGVGAEGFFAKNMPAGAPNWVRTARLPAPGSSMDREELDYVLVDDVPTLAWLANLAAIELRVPQWHIRRSGSTASPGPVDLLVFDLDPGPPATIVECCQVALLIREHLEADGLTAWPKTSGGKGLQLYVPVKSTSAEKTSEYARTLAEQLEAAHPTLIVAKMAKRLRPKKIFIDWSQNNDAKTTVAPYSVRARSEPTVSTPVTWDEVAACKNPGRLRFLTKDVLNRIDKYGDLMAPLLAKKGRPRLP